MTVRRGDARQYSYLSQEMSFLRRKILPRHSHPFYPSLPIFFITFLISYPPASVTVIQIPIVIYVDINGNPRGCVPSLRSLTPPSRWLKDAATSHVSRSWVQILCFIESELSLLLLALRCLSPSVPPLRPVPYIAHSLPRPFHGCQSCGSSGEVKPAAAPDLYEFY